MHRRRKSRGLGGAAYTKQSLKAQAKACGSHYFDPSSMRFFNSKLLAVYPAAKKNATYFVEGKGGESRGTFSSIPRHYQVGVFQNCRVESIGQGVGRGKGKGVYNSAAKAKKVAEAIAIKASGYGATLKKRKRR